MPLVTNGSKILRGAKAVARLQENGQKIEANLVQQITRHNMVVNVEELLIRAVKIVRSDYASAYNTKVKYEKNRKVFAADYQPTAACGQGLHFSGSEREARDNMGAGATKPIVCDCDLTTAVAIGQSKFKVQWCIVRGDGNENQFDKYGWEEPPPAALLMATAWW